MGQFSGGFRTCLRLEIYLGFTNQGTSGFCLCGRCANSPESWESSGKADAWKSERLRPGNLEKRYPNRGFQNLGFSIIFHHPFWGFPLILETSKWLFELDDEANLYLGNGCLLFNQTSILKWLFRVPGSSMPNIKS